MTATYGPMSPQPFAYYDPDGCCWRTSQGTFDLGSIECSPTLPPSGSMRNGELFERPMLAPPTAGSGCSSSQALPTPTARDWKDGHYQPNVPINGLLGRAVWMLPTPKASDGPNGGPGMRNSRGQADALPGIPDFGPYTPAIHRWEHALGRPAPNPTEPGKDGRPRLSPRFVEWMMGLPEGWVTGVPGISRTQALKILGNGVVPQQAALALEQLT